MIESLSLRGLELLKHDLELGGKQTLALVEKKITQLELQHRKICATCGNGVTTTNYTLLFGPHDLRKKASFCGIDCLERFQQRLRSFSE